MFKCDILNKNKLCKTNNLSQLDSFIFIYCLACTPDFRTCYKYISMYICLTLSPWHVIILVYTVSIASHLINNLVLCRFSHLSCSVPPADCQLREQVGDGHGSAAAFPGHPGVHGPQQSGSVPQGGARDHHWTAHPASSGVSRWTGQTTHEHRSCWFIF